MVSQGLPIVFALSASICGALWDQPISAQTQSMPAVSAPLEQMMPHNGPPIYPSTSPLSTSVPNGVEALRGLP